MASPRRGTATSALSARDVAEYLADYVRRYREEYSRFTAAPPNGCGYPELDISPYLSASTLTAYLAVDGCAIADFSNEPDYRWEIAGGPAWMIDSEPTQVPQEIVQLLRDQGIYGKNIGIYRLVTKEPLSADVRTGRLPPAVSEARQRVGSTRIVVKAFSISFTELIARLTFGAVGRIVDFHLPNVGDDFWTPRIIRGMGVTTADRKLKRWLNYLELQRHVDPAAWDRRSVWVRVNVDVRRHFLHAIGMLDKPGASIALEGPEAPLDLITDKLSLVKKAIDGFAQLLNERRDDPESTFHNYLAANPIILDPYGAVESKPKFVYPPGESLLGKKYVEPDFLIRYPGRRYKLVELERPNKGLATNRGEPRGGVTQAAFQIGEWKDFIQNHYEVLKSRYPGISSIPRTQVVISRSTAEQSGVPDVDRYLAMIRQQLHVDDVITYDILLQEMQEAYARLSGAML